MRMNGKLSLGSTLAALGVSACCVLPVSFILLGMGGGWLAIFGNIAAVSYYVLACATLFIGYSALMSYRRGMLSRLKWWLISATSLTAIAWVIVLNKARINDYLISRM